MSHVGAGDRKPPPPLRGADRRAASLVFNDVTERGGARDDLVELGSASLIGEGRVHLDAQRAKTSPEHRIRLSRPSRRRTDGPGDRADLPAQHQGRRSVQHGRSLRGREEAIGSARPNGEESERGPPTPAMFVTDDFEFYKVGVTPGTAKFSLRWAEIEA